jgi:esterase/lipase superfamily enzyme
VEILVSGLLIAICLGGVATGWYLRARRRVSLRDQARAEASATANADSGVSPPPAAHGPSAGTRSDPPTVIAPPAPAPPRQKRIDVESEEAARRAREEEKGRGSSEEEARRKEDRRKEAIQAALKARALQPKEEAARTVPITEEAVRQAIEAGGQRPKDEAARRALEDAARRAFERHDTQAAPEHARNKQKLLARNRVPICQHGHVYVGDLSYCRFCDQEDQRELAERPRTGVHVFFATDRVQLAREGVVDFGVERGTALSLGQAIVSIPATHRRGVLERPSLLRLEFRENARRHIVLTEVVLRDVDQFIVEVDAEIRDSGRDQAFLFVHGFNVSFAEACRRAGQLGFDLQDFTPFVFSWPSRAEVIDYIADSTSVRWCVPHLIEFVNLLCSRTAVSSLHIIGHSMGVQALAELIPTCLHRVEVKELILAAADIDRNVFEEQIAPMLSGQRRTTVYACQTDEALSLSRRLNRGYPRLGDCEDGICVAPGIDTIDVSGVAHSLLNHSTVFDVRTMVEDLHRLMDNGIRAERRGLIPKESRHGRYWAVAPG